jgi:hypothetical protein
MVADDLDEPVEDSCASLRTSLSEILSNSVAVARMTSCELSLELTDRLRVAESLPREVVVFPAKGEPPSGVP